MSALSIPSDINDPNMSSSNSHEKNLVDKNFEQNRVEPSGRKASVKQRNYILNDVGALKKKLKAEGKKHEVSIGKEAKDASNITVPMKASFFEFVKAHFINDMLDNVNILKVDNAEGVKAATDNFGDAFVEYLMEITFKVNKHVHCIKLTAYTTTSQLVFQPIGEKSGPKEHLGQKGTPRFFVENFLLPWCSKAISEKRYNEDIASKYYTALKEEIRKLDIMKLDMKKANKSTLIEVDSMSKADAKCAAKVCNFQGINPQNRAAVGVCAKCGNVEHFACVKIKTDHKEDIIRGVQKYFCSTCFTNNPSLILPETGALVRSRERLDSLPLMGQGYLRITHSTTAKPVQKDQNTEIKKCGICDFQANSLQELGTHLDTEHKPKCFSCDKTFETSTDLIKHTAKEHNIQCNICDASFTDKKRLKEHTKNTHEHACQHCDDLFCSTEELKDHVESNHKFPCSSCNQIFNGENEVEHHIIKNHRYSCSTCTSIFKSHEDLNRHIETEHSKSTEQCPFCQESFPNKSDLEAHVSKQHEFSCNICDKTFTNKKSLKEHYQNVHEHVCQHCDDHFSSSENLRDHIESKHKSPNPSVNQVLNEERAVNNQMDTNHMFSCSTCTEIFKSKDDLKEHMDKEHISNQSINFGTSEQVEPIEKCSFCPESFPDKSNLDTHVIAKHTYACKHCEAVLTTNTALDEHLQESHAFLCLTCNTSFPTEIDSITHKDAVHRSKDMGILTCFTCEIIFKSVKDVKNHMEEEHTHECETCHSKFKTKTLLRKHISDSKHMQIAKFKCQFCNESPTNNEDLQKHIQNEHTFTCETCEYTGIGEEAMEDHILEKHGQPDNNGWYKCDDCTFQSREKSDFGEHFKTNHGSNSKSISNKTSEKEIRLEIELRQLKNNLGRLEAIYHEALEENNNIKSEYEAKLMTVQDDLTTTKAQNEALEEKVDILFKLGRSYLEQGKTTTIKDNTKDKNIDEIIEIDNEQTDVSIESLESWTTKKLRGFKRVNPAANCVSTGVTNLTYTAPKKKHSSSSSSPSSGKSLSPSTPAPAQPDSTPPPSDMREAQQSEKQSEFGRDKFCHYFVNMGKCTFEERTGKKCKFQHRQAPMCRLGTSCGRPKCMYSHPKLNGKNNFLEYPREYHPQMNPWQIGHVMNPWIIPQTNQFIPNPWNMGKTNTNIWNNQRNQ